MFAWIEQLIDDKCDRHAKSRSSRWWHPACNQTYNFNALQYTLFSFT